LAVAVTIVAFMNLWRLRRDWLTLQAAERLEAVDLTSVVKRHVPGELLTNRPSEEIPLAREGIGRKRLRWRAAAIVLGAVTLSAGAAAFILTKRDLRAIAAAGLPAQVLAPADVTKAVSGVWGLEHDFLLSCSQNPHTISLDEGQRKLRMRLAKPVWNGSETTSDVDYDIIGVEPNTLVLSRTAGPARDNFGQPLRWIMSFVGPDTYSMKRSDQPTRSSGVVVRCN
jgi:hypothetical protein